MKNKPMFDILTEFATEITTADWSDPSKSFSKLAKMINKFAKQYSKESMGLIERYQEAISNENYGKADELLKEIKEIIK